MELSLAYIAGFFDGEGCVQMVGPPKRLEFKITVGNTDRTILDELCMRFGGSVTPNPMGSKNHTVYIWKPTTAGAIEFAKAILPFSRVKYTQLKHFLEARTTLRKASGAYPLTEADLQERQLAIDTLKRLRTETY